MLYCFNCVQLLQHHGLQAASLLYPWDSSGKNTEVGCCALLQTLIFLFQCLQYLLQALQNLFEFKMGPKAADTTCNINTFGPGTANECTVSWGFKKFCKGDESLEDEGLANASWQRPIERIIEADSLTTTWEVAKELSVSHSLVFWHLKLIGKVKKLISGCSWADHK